MKNLQTISKWGYCALTADYLHHAHIIFLNKCKKYCQKLYVGIMTDECVNQYKGKHPLQTVYEREMVIRSLKMVNGTFIQNTFEFPTFILNLAARKGKDFHIFDSEEHSRRGATIIFPRKTGISSTDLKLLHHEDSYNCQFAL